MANGEDRAARRATSPAEFGSRLSAHCRGNRMLAFAIRRLLEALIVMLTVALLAFVLFRYVGDPVNQMVGQDTSLEDRLKLRAGARPRRPDRASSSAASSATRRGSTSASPTR